LNVGVSIKKKKESFFLKVRKVKKTNKYNLIFELNRKITKITQQTIKFIIGKFLNSLT